MCVGGPGEAADAAACTARHLNLRVGLAFGADRCAPAPHHREASCAGAAAATSSPRKAVMGNAPEPPKNPKTKAPPKGEPPMICVAATPVRHPSKTTIPETGVATPPAQQAPLPPPELEHTPRVRRRWAEGGGRDRMCSTLYST